MLRSHIYKKLRKVEAEFADLNMAARLGCKNQPALITKDYKP